MHHARTIAIESAVGALVVACISMLVWPADLGMSATSTHPVWFVILLMAARYGHRGLFFALVLTVAVFAPLACVFAGSESLSARVQRRADLVPLGCAVAVAWVAISHRSRITRISSRISELAHDHVRTRDWANALRASNRYLRDRCDRIEASVNLWRSVAGRLERGDMAQAADAALELAMIRTGATAACAQRTPRTDSTSIIATRGAWPGTSCPYPSEPMFDSTVQAAICDRRPRLAIEIAGTTSASCDVAVPVLDTLDGSSLGAIALRGVHPARLRPAELRDLEIIAAWLSPAIARQAKGPRLHAVPDGLAR